MEGWIALGGLAVALATLITAHLRDTDARTAAYRTRVYDKQVDAITELVPLVIEHYNVAALYVFVGTLADGPDAPLTDHDSHTVTSKLLDTRSQVNTALQRLAVILPKGTAEALEQYLDAVSDQRGKYATLGQAQKAFDAAYERIIQQMRRDLGTDPLTEANLRAMGVLANERPDALRESYRKYDERMRGRY